MPQMGQGYVLMDVTIFVLALLCVLLSGAVLFRNVVETRSIVLAWLYLIAWGSIAARLGWWLWNYQDAPVSIPFGIALLALCASSIVVLYPKCLSK